MDTIDQDLKLKWEQLKFILPGLSYFSAAERLKVGEAELIFTEIGEEVHILKSDFGNLLNEVGKLGESKIVCRNPACVQEIKGNFTESIRDTNGVLKFENDTNELSVLDQNIKYGFSINKEKEKSFQFFDKYGASVLKIILTPASDEKIFDELIKKYKSENQNPEFEVEPEFEVKPKSKPQDSWLSDFHSDWKNMEEIDDFQEILKKYGLSEFEAVNLAPDDYFSKKIKNRKIVGLLERLTESDFGIGVVTKNHACALKYSGKIENHSWHEAWFNVFGSDFSLHIDTSKIVETRIVRKPTNVGFITSVECFDAYEELIVELYCQREKGMPELNEWRKLVDDFEE